MGDELTCEQQLDIISRAWGMQDGGGYVFFPWITGKARNKEERVRGYHEGPGFRWPEDRADIIAHLQAHTNDDVYWCPNMFEKHIRRREFAMDECALWADLDDVDPRGLDEFKPTIAWQTSQDHYQALWITRRPMLGASWPGEENQKLTYYLGADNNGWDSTQLLRLPGGRNHKPERRKGKTAWQGRLLWDNGPRYSRHQFESLPEVQGRTDAIRQVLESDLDAVDTSQVMARVRLKLSKRVREFLTARELPNKGKRSEILWEIERELADAGCTLAEIIAIVKRSVWNKYSGRSDELLRLSTEASRALDEVKESTPIEDEWDESVSLIADVLRDIKPPKWLVKGIWTEGSCGFIAGEPKTWKSWMTLDLAISIATGHPFLDSFSVVEPGPVLYFQEEDTGPRMKERYQKMMASKAQWRIEIVDSVVFSIPADPLTDNPLIDTRIRSGIVLSEELWQERLRDKLSRGLNGQPYKAVILDPLMYMLGSVDENRAGDMMTKILKPLKVLASEYECAIIVVHHLKKQSANSSSRPAQNMLGSVANHAWTEDSLYVQRSQKDLTVTVESKTAVGGTFKVAGLHAPGWQPQVYDSKLTEEVHRDQSASNDIEVRQVSSRSKDNPKIIASVRALGNGLVTTQQVADEANLSHSGAHKQLARATKSGHMINPSPGKWRLNLNGTK